ncbi:hypothetical protein KKD52_03290 [Myxococcota bacterium]|jgi:hypothetical protein|nr:hypothetical protein [Myxococcota bacterium]MBU1410013.1 hypothetical protein [Myxococcota bacterium]MBU1509364.1 hypothetical protein [Myxococcota bacterium]PKN26398.1 MAG: hypothetical protein CVU65_05850 [Deltaproteobacteria bacterium HGW-Deltaproteobacteria-22]
MEVLPLITEMLIKVEVRNQHHPMRLYGTLARGAVWSCLNRVSWAMPDLARVLRWGVGRGLINRAEARRMWTLMRLLVGPETSSDGPPGPTSPPWQPDLAWSTAPAVPEADPSGSAGGGPNPQLRTQLHVLHGLARPWQEWATEKINRNQEEKK